MKQQWFILVVVHLKQLESIVGGVIYCTYNRFIIGWQGWILDNPSESEMREKNPSDRFFFWIFSISRWIGVIHHPVIVPQLWCMLQQLDMQPGTRQTAKICSRQLKGPVQPCAKKRNCNRFNSRLSAWIFADVFLCQSTFVIVIFQDIAVALLKAQVGSEVWIGPL